MVQAFFMGAFVFAMLGYQIGKNAEKVKAKSKARMAWDITSTITDRVILNCNSSPNRNRLTVTELADIVAKVKRDYYQNHIKDK